MTYKIEKDIPVLSVYKYPFRDMELGDSFAFDLQEFIKIRSAAWIYGKKTNRKFRVHIKGRCWRIK